MAPVAGFAADPLSPPPLSAPLVAPVASPPSSRLAPSAAPVAGAGGRAGPPGSQFYPPATPAPPVPRAAAPRLPRAGDPGSAPWVAPAGSGGGSGSGCGSGNGSGSGSGCAGGWLSGLRPAPAPSLLALPGAPFARSRSRSSSSLSPPRGSPLGAPLLCASDPPGSSVRPLFPSLSVSARRVAPAAPLPSAPSVAPVAGASARAASPCLPAPPQRPHKRLRRGPAFSANPLVALAAPAPGVAVPGRAHSAVSGRLGALCLACGAFAGSPTQGQVGLIELTCPGWVPLFSPAAAGVFLAFSAEPELQGRRPWSPAWHAAQRRGFLAPDHSADRAPRTRGGP